MTKEDFLRKIRSLIPSWTYSNEPRRFNAVLGGIASVLEKFQEDVENNINETFLDQSTGEYLDLYGSGRGLPRFDGEVDSAYRARLKEYQSTTSCRSLKQIVDSLVANGESRIVEGGALRSFLNEEAFIGVNFSTTGFQARNVFFTVHIDPQIPPPLSFLGFNTFLDNDLFAGTLDSKELILDRIITAVENTKAFGVKWELIEGELGSTDEQIKRRDRVLALIEGPDNNQKLAQGEFGQDTVPIEVRS